MSETKDLILDEMKDLLNNKEFMKQMIKAINDDIDIPMLNEKTERKVFEKLYKILCDELLQAIEH